MELTSFFVIFLALIERTCPSKIINTQADDFAKLEDAAIHILTTCYGDKGNTVALIGDFPASFILRLLSKESISLVLIDTTRRVESLDFSRRGSELSLHKLNIFVFLAGSAERLGQLMRMQRRSVYNNPMAFVLIIGWSSIKNRSSFVSLRDLAVILRIPPLYQILNAKLLCLNRTRDPVIYGFNSFVNQAPKPWENFFTAKISGDFLYVFDRDYLEVEDVCENLDFDKTRDVGGTKIVLINYYHREAFEVITKMNKKPGIVRRKNNWNELAMSRKQIIENEETLQFFEVFIAYVNATTLRLATLIIPGGGFIDRDGIHTRPIQLKGIDRTFETYAYPYGVHCKVLISQSRGNMTQLEKIFAVIDSNSWYGMYAAYFVTLFFFMYFLRQPPLVGILNLCRLTCNCGLTTVPRNDASRVYLGCLLFFVVTMQGIFSGNLASLLTHDIPVRQVNSKQDAIDLGYKVWVNRLDAIHFNDPALKGRVIVKAHDEECFDTVASDPLMACLVWNARDTEKAMAYDLHVSKGCITKSYHTNVLPASWALTEKFNNFVGSMTAAKTMAPFATMVNKKRMEELEAIEDPLDPEIMTLKDLDFAFVILGVGLSCAFIVFIAELMVYRFQHRIKTTRVIVLN